MDYFSLGLNIFCLVLQGAMHISFAAALPGKDERYGIMLYIFYFSVFWIGLRTRFPFRESLESEWKCLFYMG